MVKWKGSLVCKNKGGFTIIEVMVAMIIMMVGLLALLQTVNLSLHHNMNNQIRNEATVLADEQMARELSKPFDLVSTNTRGTVISRNFMNGFKNYSVTRSGSSALTYSKQVNIAVSWRHKNVRSIHETSSLVSKTNR